MKIKFFNRFVIQFTIILLIIFTIIIIYDIYKNDKILHNYSLSINKKTSEKYINEKQNIFINSLNKQYELSSTIIDFITSNHDIANDLISQNYNEHFTKLFLTYVSYFNLDSGYIIDNKGNIVFSNKILNSTSFYNDIFANLKLDTRINNITKIITLLFEKDPKSGIYYNYYFFPFSINNNKFIFIFKFKSQQILLDLYKDNNKNQITYIFNKNKNTIIYNQNNSDNNNNINFNDLKKITNDIALKKESNLFEILSINNNQSDKNQEKFIAFSSITKFLDQEFLIIHLNKLDTLIDKEFKTKLFNENLIAFLVVYLIILVIILIIFKLINLINKNLQFMASGNLSDIKLIKIKLNNEIGIMNNSFNKSYTKLKEIIFESHELVERLSETASDISNASIELSNRTESSASSLEETTAMLEEATGSIKRNIENLNDINKNSELIKDLSKEGKKKIESALNSISNVVKMASKINEISDFINELTFQTNLLSLNAAVEAARAGEAGKGFAVVAAEIRNLAQKSAKSAKEITELITNINKEINLTDLSSKEVDKSFQILTEKINNTINSIHIVSNSFNEQFNIVEQITNTIINLNEITQDNASFAEEFSSTAENLYASFENLKYIISFFKIDKINTNKINSKNDNISNKLTKDPISKKDKTTKINNEKINEKHKNLKNLNSANINKFYNNSKDKEEFSNYEEF